MDSERPIEKKLREYAAHRREQQGAPPELHPVTRKLLQAEVARTHRSDGQTSAAGRSWLWPWPKLAWACLAIAFVGILWMFAPAGARKSRAPVSSELVFNRTPETQTPSVPGQVGPTVSAPVEEAARLVEAGRAGEYRFTPTQAPSGASAGTQLALAAPALKVTDIASSAFLAAAQTTNGQLSQNLLLFRNQVPVLLSNTAGNAQQRQTPPVLVNFQVDQQGDRLQIVDSDGSVYSGAARLLAAVPARSEPVLLRDRAIRRARADQNQPATAQPATALSAVQNYSFQVVGTNITLNQRVVFSGVLLEDASAPIGAGQVANVGLQFRNNTQLQNISFTGNTQNSTANRRISGKAVIGTSQELPVEAIAAP